MTRIFYLPIDPEMAKSNGSAQLHYFYCIEVVYSHHNKVSFIFFPLFPFTSSISDIKSVFISVYQTTTEAYQHKKYRQADAHEC